jgi:hypothetical protein
VTRKDNEAGIKRRKTFIVKIEGGGHQESLDSQIMNRRCRSSLAIFVLTLPTSTSTATIDAVPLFGGQCDRINQRRVLIVGRASCSATGPGRGKKVRPR